MSTEWRSEPVEQILAVDRKALEALLPKESFVTEGLSEVRRFIQAHHSYYPREQAEYDRSLKQIIPYVVVTQRGRYFLLRRLKKQTEARLHDKLSLGVGGHINPTEESAGDVIEAGLRRELAEEVYVEKVRSLTCVGVINENSGGVSDYHTALVYLLEAEGEVRVLETEKMSGGWATPAELADCCEELENWSQIVFRHWIQQYVK